MHKQETGGERTSHLGVTSGISQQMVVDEDDDDGCDCIFLLKIWVVNNHQWHFASAGEPSSSQNDLFINCMKGEQHSGGGGGGMAQALHRLVCLGSVTRNGVVNRGAVRYLSVFARFRCGPLAATPGVQRAHKWNPNDERRRKFFLELISSSIMFMGWTLLIRSSGILIKIYDSFISFIMTTDTRSWTRNVKWMGGNHYQEMVAG